MVGLGYVGLPLAHAASQSGLAVTGYDTSVEVVGKLNAGISHIDDLSDEDVAHMLQRSFGATSDSCCIGLADVVVICVPTPLREDGTPNIDMVTAATQEVASHLRSGQLVILESTTYPGTTEEVVLPILETSGLKVGLDFNCAFSPERIDPGNSKFGITNTPKVVGGVTEACTKAAADFYQGFIETVVLAKGTREAELAKLLENTYRHVNIALVNELVQFCEPLGIDLWDSIRCAATKPFGFEAFYPGPGVGGHCIPIDPNYLSHRVKTFLGTPFRFVELAEEINQRMPAYVVQRVQDLLNNEKKSMKGSEILLLGITYKPNIGDRRESPADDVAAELLARGAAIHYNDPFVESWTVTGRSVPRVGLEDAAQLSGFDAVVLLQAHEHYRNFGMEEHGVPVLDTRGFLQGDLVVRL